MKSSISMEIITYKALENNLKPFFYVIKIGTFIHSRFTNVKPVCGNSTCVITKLYYVKTVFVSRNNIQEFNKYLSYNDQVIIMKLRKYSLATNVFVFLIS